MQVSLNKGRAGVSALTINMGDCFILLRNGKVYIKTDIPAGRGLITAINLETGASLKVGNDESVNVIELKAREV